MAKGIFKGQFIKIDYSSLELTDELEEAMEALDEDCAHGSGGTWDIFEEEPENGVPFRAVFSEFASDELVWNSEAGSWTDGYEEEEEEEEEEEVEGEEGEDYMLTFVG